MNIERRDVLILLAEIKRDAIKRHVNGNSDALDKALVNGNVETIKRLLTESTSNTRSFEELQVIKEIFENNLVTFNAPRAGYTILGKKYYRQQPKIQTPPGSSMLRIAEVVVSKKKYERDCMAALADWHEEYFEALDQERGKTKMASIRIRHTWALFKATGWLFGLDTIGKLITKLLGKISGA